MTGHYSGARLVRWAAQECDVVSSGAPLAELHTHSGWALSLAALVGGLQGNRQLRAAYSQADECFLPAE
jgi:hypothetical protein